VESAPKKRRGKKAVPAPEPRALLILSRKESLYSTRRLIEAAQARQSPARVLDTLHCNLVLERGRPGIVYRDEEELSADRIAVVVPRIGASITNYGLAVVNQFDMMGVPVLNNSVPIARSRDKLRSLQLLARFGIDIPRTIIAREAGDVQRALDHVGGLPVIVKFIQGTQGVGVMIASTQPELESILSTMKELGQEILVQEFVAESKGKDVRCIVVGDRVVAAMRRRARSGEFRSNIHRGGAGEAVALDEAYAEAAVKASRVMGLEVAGVDMLESSEGPKLMEVNSSPGLEGIEKATGVDVAGAIVEHALRFGDAHRSGWQKTRLI
jgi:ribosomal protein S6--L-glutamate ligase